MKRLVIVDDDALVRSSTALYFEGAGWAVRQAATADEALARLREPFDVLICDLHLSPARVAEGVAVLVEARRLAPAAALVLMTGGAADNLGAARPDAVVAKPIRLAALDALVTGLLAKR